VGDDDGVGRYDDARSGQPEGHDEVDVGWLRPPLNWRPRWLVVIGVALIAVALIAVAAGTVIGHGREAPAASAPVTVVEVGHRLLGVTAGWDLFGRGSRQVVRIQFARGRITRTIVPPVQSTGPVSFVAGPGQAIIRPLDFVPGYVVFDGQPARGLRATLSHGGVIVPGPAPGRVWVQAGGGDRALVQLTRLDGSKTGEAIALPAGGPWLLTSDGRGYLLLYGTGVMYDAWPGGLRRITGAVAAVGPTRWLTVECRNQYRCSNVVIDPASGTRRVLPGRPAESVAFPGAIAPDGSAAAIFRVTGAGNPALELLNLVSGAYRRLAVPLDQLSLSPQTLAWSPDSQWLFVVAAHGKLLAINARTQNAYSLGAAIPPINQIAIRNAPRQSRGITSSWHPQ
jgi:hypothetical protein